MHKLPAFLRLFLFLPFTRQMECIRIYFPGPNAKKTLIIDKGI